MVSISEETLITNGIARMVSGTFEKSATTMAGSFTADAIIQSTSNLAEGKDVIDNYDVVGGITS